MTLATPTTALDYFQDYSPIHCTLRRETPIEECQTLLTEVEVRRDATQWWIGDTINQARDLYGESYSQLIPEDKVEVYRQYAWVASQIPLDLRTEAIPYSWYRDAAKLPLERLWAIVEAATDDDGACIWNARQWREAVAEAKGTTPKERRTARAKADDVLSYARNHEGKPWSHEDTAVLQDLLA